MQLNPLKLPKEYLLLLIATIVPIVDLISPNLLDLTTTLRPIIVFSLLALGLNIVTGSTGLLHLGVSGFMAIGAYAYAISSCDIYPFQFGFWGSLIVAAAIGGLIGLFLGFPTLRLRGDYLAIVTLGFGEILQDVIRNLDLITKGTQGINPLPTPSLFSIQLTSNDGVIWYYLYLAILSGVVFINRNLLTSRIGRSFVAVREDELAASCMGVPTVRVKLQAFTIGAAICSLAGALWACHLGSTGEPGNFDFQISIITLCIVIVGGLGSISGVLLGAIIVIGFNSIVLVKLSQILADAGWVSSGDVFLTPNNWKYAVFGLALILMMRVKPDGLIPYSSRRKG